MRLQKLVVVMSALAGGIASVNSHALGLGEVKLYSALNQPLVAEIELMQVNDLTRREILSNLATKSDFERAGVDRPFMLNNLQFKTEVGTDGKGLIKVTSSGPIHEPYLNFLVEVHWPSGRLLKEYTLLLDPPAFNGQSSVPVVKPMSAPAHYGTKPVLDEPPTTNRDYLPSPDRVDYKDYNQRQPVQPGYSDPGVSSYNQSSADGAGVSGKTYRVERNDSLWEIAEKVRPGSDITVQQTMLAIQRGNPQAFVDNNINRLKSGQVLRIPDRQDITRLTVREAIADVSRQNREWQGRSRVAQLDATRRTSATSKGGQKSVDGKLAIVSGEAASGQGQDLGGGSAEGNAALQTELAMTREQLDKLSRENAELKSRLKDLDDQIATLKRLMTMKDDQMAALQSQGKPKEVTQPKPIQRQPESVMQPSMMDVLFGSPVLLMLLALLPLGGAGFLFYQRRNKKKQETMTDEDDEMDFQPLDLDEEDPIDSPKPVVKPSEEDELKFDEALAIDDSVIDEFEDDEETTQQTEDPLSEADIYIAYGRLNQAEELLNQAIFNEPGRADLRLKLLEVHSESGDLDKFKQALAALEATGDSDAIRAADAFKARFPDEFKGVAETVEEDVMPDFDLDDLDLGDDDEQNVDSLDDFDLDLDDFDMGSEPEVAARPEKAPEAVADSADEDDLDFDLDDLDLEFGSDAEDTLAQDSQAAFSDEGVSSLEASLDDDLDFLSEGDEVATKLDLARAYMDMGDMEGASAILQEVMEQGSDEQKQEAMSLMKNAGGN